MSGNIGGCYNFIKSEIEYAKSYNNNLLTKLYDSFGHTSYDLSILSFLQHYGAPTPFLDFTTDFNYALFFATDGLNYYPCSDINNYFSIYAIDTDEYEFMSIIHHIDSSVAQIDDAIKKYTGYKIDDRDILNDIESLNISFFYGLKLFYIPGYITGGIDFKISSRPKFKLLFNQHNLNIISQKGLFVFNYHETLPLEDFFTEVTTKNNPTFRLNKIKCWNIHKSLKNHVLTCLEKKKINKELIYPQEENIAKSAYENFMKFQ